jgi:hypothetical protein
MILIEIVLKLIVWTLIEIGFVKLMIGACKAVEKFYEWMKYEVFG